MSRLGLEPHDISWIEVEWAHGGCNLNRCVAAERVLIYTRTGQLTDVGVRRDAAGELTADEPRRVDPSIFVPPSPPDRPRRLAAIGVAPGEISHRAKLMLCGVESSGLAGPFDADARSCFIAAARAGAEAEFVSRRADSEGNGFTELWRLTVAEGIIVYVESAGAWQKLQCAVQLLEGLMQFTHGECTIEDLTAGLRSAPG